MAGLNTDLFSKVARKLVAQIGAGGVANATDTTIPLSSATNFPTTTGVLVVIDRVDANGVKTPTLEETIIGVISGTNLVTCTRGVEGTAQAHLAGAVVEVLITAKGWNNMVDGFVVQHSQLGVHDPALVAMLAGTQIITGVKTFGSAGAVSRLKIAGTTSGSVTLDAPAVASTYVATLPAATDTLVGKATTDTLTNKTITKRVTALTSHATPTINTDNCDWVDITAQAEAITSMTTNLSGTPTNKQLLAFEIKDNGTARAITWGASFVAGGTALPTTTVISKILLVLLR